MTRMGTPRRQAEKTALALLAALVLALAALPGAAHAIGTLDQQQTEVFETDAGFAIFDRASPPGPPPPGQSVAQTFTAGISGGLDQVDLNLFQFATLPVTVEIRTVDGGAPTETVLTSAVVPASSVPSFPGAAFVAVPFAQPAPVVAGTQYAIVLHSAEDQGGYGWRHSAGDVYAGGRSWFAFSSPPTTSWTNVVPDTTFIVVDDAAFKTYVTSVAPVAPTAKSQCKKGGWHGYSQFKNQGQCVSFVVHQRT